MTLPLAMLARILPRESFLIQCDREIAARRKALGDARARNASVETLHRLESLLLQCIDERETERNIADYEYLQN